MASGGTVFALLLGSNLPNALFPLYGAVYHLPPVGITLLFATYTLLVIPAVLVFGPLSDAKGRREILVVAILVSIVSTALFAVADNVATLFIAQALEAMAMGALQGTAAPTLVDYDPSERPRRAAMVASAATLAGATAGPVLGGLLGQYGPLPLRLSFVVEIAILLGAAAAVMKFLPPRTTRTRWRPRRPSVPKEIRRRFAVAGIAAFVAWAVAGLFLSLVPTFVVHVLGDHNLAVAGAAMAVFLAVSTVTQLLGHRFDPLRCETVGLAAMALGVGLLIVAVVATSLSILLVASVFAGAGQGLCFMGSLGDVSEVAPADRKGDIVASYYVLIYVATALPAIGVGLAAQAWNFSDAFISFGGGVAALCAVGVFGLSAELRRTNASARRA